MTGVMSVIPVQKDDVHALMGLLYLLYKFFILNALDFQPFLDASNFLEIFSELTVKRSKINRQQQIEIL